MLAMRLLKNNIHFIPTTPRSIETVAMLFKEKEKKISFDGISTSLTALVV